MHGSVLSPHGRIVVVGVSFCFLVLGVLAMSEKVMVSRSRLAAEVVRGMVAAGHMHGFLGDDSPEFQAGAVADMLNADPVWFHNWVDLNEFNLRNAGVYFAACLLRGDA